MARRREVHAELEELKDDLVRGEGGRGKAASKAVPNPDDDAEPSGLRLQHLLDEIESHLGHAAEETEDLISAYPLAAVASAFMLGLLIGRYTRRA
jgi:ElaB/YqjD/DUF883 family membrane-anchored ribosome-binding protein